MCKDNVTEKGSRINDTSKAEAHRLAGLALLTQLHEMIGIRSAYNEIRARHDENTAGLDEMEEIISHELDRIVDEAHALVTFVEEFDCDCGCSDGPEPRTFEDEERPDTSDGRERDVEEKERSERADVRADGGRADGEDDEFDLSDLWPPHVAERLGYSLGRRSAAAVKRAPSKASMVFGALGVGCALAALASQWVSERKG